jgi:hypothetical protein
MNITCAKLVLPSGSLYKFGSFDIRSYRIAGDRDCCSEGGWLTALSEA